jgi:hypothetical protein
MICNMPCDGAIIFRDLVGKLTMVNVECAKCGRFGQYRLDRSSIPSMRSARPGSFWGSHGDGLTVAH